MDYDKEIAMFSLDGGFAEIEIAETPGVAAPAQGGTRLFSPVAVTDQIKERASDPVRQKFFDMRSLASGKPFARDDSELFYKQAKFMEDFTDDYEGKAAFFMYYPYYQHMGYEQLRTYFTWRTRARSGELRAAPDSYVFLYIYELLSGIGASDPLDGLGKLMAVWKEFALPGSAFESYLPKWFRDYHIYYDLPHGFEDFVREYGLQKLYPLMLILDAGESGSLALWNELSSYDATKSAFYRDGNEALFCGCFARALAGISDFCAVHGSGIEDLLIYRVSNRIPWRPFRKALFHNWLSQPDRKIIMPGKERYYCQNNAWTASLPLYYSTQADFIGYIIKKTESCLRQAVGYKHKLSADLKIAGYSYLELRDMASDIKELDAVIEKSVADFHRETTRTVVTVDHGNLARIRKEALGTQEKLTIPDDGPAYVPGAEPAMEPERDGLLRGKGFGRGDEALGGGDTGTGTGTGTDTGTDADAGADADGDGDGDGWAALKNALSPQEIEALRLIFAGNADIRAFADKAGVMQEVLADGINEKAADLIGDGILETGDGVTIYAEYRDNVAGMLNRPIT